MYFVLSAGIKFLEFANTKATQIDCILFCREAKILEFANSKATVYFILFCWVAKIFAICQHKSNSNDCILFSRAAKFFGICQH
jgi:hypothetical protein